MYDDMTFGFILGRMLKAIPDDVDKREGSVIYDALAPAALELAQFYSELGVVIDETFADTAGREMLIRRAAERGIVPYPATSAVVQGEFDVPVPIGSRFAIDDLRYTIQERQGQVSGNVYSLVCDVSGSVGNRSVGELLPLNFIEGLAFAQITKLLIPGRDDEDTEQLRKRYLDSLEAQSYGGNISDYKRMVLSIQGVGGVKVEPAFDGGGTVRLILQDDLWQVPSEMLVAQVKNTIDPKEHSGLGVGMAPIGHSVTVVPVNGVAVDVTARFTLAAGWTFAALKSDLCDIVAKYLEELASGWSSSDELIVRTSQIEARLLNESQGRIVDIEDLRINDCSPNANMRFPPDTIPLRGDVNDE